MKLFSIDLDRLRDDEYMEVITSGNGWETLNHFIRSTVILQMIDQLKRSGTSESVKEQIIQTFLRNLSPEEMADLREAIEADRFLDTLIKSLGDLPT